MIPVLFPWMGRVDPGEGVGIPPFTLWLQSPCPLSEHILSLTPVIKVEP